MYADVSKCCYLVIYLFFLYDSCFSKSLKLNTVCGSHNERIAIAHRERERECMLGLNENQKLKLICSCVTDGIHPFSVVSVAEGLTCDWL